MKRERPTDGTKRGTNTRLGKERKRERENGKKERRRRRKKGASARNNAQSHGEECGPSGYTRIHERTWWVPIGRPSILSSQREDTRGLFSTGDKYTGEFTALPVVTSFRLFQVNRARGRVANRDSVVCGRSLWRERDANDHAPYCASAVATFFSR